MRGISTTKLAHNFRSIESACTKARLQLTHSSATGTAWERTPWRATQGGGGGAQNRRVLSAEGLGCYPLGARHVRGGAPTMDQQGRTCPQCSQTISPDDTIVFSRRLLGHLDCRRPRVLSAEERTLLSIYCREHQVAECARCTGRFHLREVASLDSFGVRTYGCQGCHTDLTDSIRAHLYGCAMLPAEVRRRAQAAREAARSLVKQSGQLNDRADVPLREAEAALYALRDTMRQPPARSRTKRPERRASA